MIIRQSHVQPRLVQPYTQVRHATYLPRPRRPYTFTQMVALSDGSTFLHRTTSPAAIYRTVKDVRNTALWNPSSQKLASAEDDEAGKLSKFRERFGRGWDASASDRQASDEEAAAEREKTRKGRKPKIYERENRESKDREKETKVAAESGMDNLMDLIAAAGQTKTEKKPGKS